MPQGQRPGARLPQQSSFRAQQGLRRSGADFGRGGQHQRVYRPDPITLNTAVNVPQTSPRTGRLEGRRSGPGRNRDLRDRDGDGTADFRNRARRTDDRNVRNRDARDGDRDRRHGHDDDWRRHHRDWHKRHEGDPDFADKHRRYHRQHYHRNWWRSHYTHFVLFGGGYYYWNSGYWYPAYGYDPYYSTYVYDAPIYAANGEAPGDIISRVQEVLQQRGYYRGAVDGQYGPQTRRALLNYQADHGLAQTGEIDEQTLRSMEL